MDREIPSRPLPHVDGVKHHYVDAGRLRVHVAEAGRGEPVVMLHGWPQHWYVYRHQIPALAERYRVICPDLRGFGWTDAPPFGYEKEALAEDVVRLLDALDLGDGVRLVGHDWGGWIGFLLCLYHRARIRRFLALNIAPPWAQLNARTVGATVRFWYQGLLATPLLGEWVLRNRPGLLRLVLTADSTRKERRSEQELDAFIAPLREPARARASVRLYRTFLLKEFPAVARGKYRTLRLRTPTLLLFGTRDFAISTSFLEGTERHGDDFRIEYVHDSGHFIAEDKPELVTERALAFFAAA